MFATYCSACAGRRLVFPSQVTRIDNGPDGPVVEFRCSCGSTGTWRSHSRGAHALAG